ncbi:MAG TPA: phosphoribosylformylglycinamidine synthase subunit PurQ [Natronosporangium sp.]
MSIRKPTVNLLYLPGTNCQAETARAFRHAGADPRLVFLNDLLAGHDRLDSADLLCLPGGFSFGDHIAAGAIGGLILRTKLHRQLQNCRTRPMICICNGFQIALRAGVFGPGVALQPNHTGTFHNRPDQPHQVVAGNPSPWLAGLAGATLRFPCAHGEGRFHYQPHNGRTGWRTALRYPESANPDGSTDHIAGITTADGLVLGLMNHPERAADRDTRLALFENGVRAARQ